LIYLSKGLTPQTFWRYKSELLRVERADLADLVKQLVLGSSKSENVAVDDWLSNVTTISKIYGKIRLCRLDDLPLRLYDRDIPSDLSLILLSPSFDWVEKDAKRVLRICLSSGKKGQHDFLHNTLPRTVEFATAIWEADAAPINILIGCEDGKDASIGVALVLLQLFFDDNGIPRGRSSKSKHQNFQRKFA
jgi:tRNA A64-2'-O-ribosylphosphate transferase